MPRHSIAPQFLRYGAAGLFGTTTHYCVLGALARGAGVGLIAASTTGAIAGAWVNYGLNYRYTFASRRPHRRALGAFWCVAVAGWALNAALLAVLCHDGRLSAIPAQLVASAVVLAAGFLVNRAWTFQ